MAGEELLVGGAIVAILGMSVYLSGLAQYRLKKIIEYTPTSKAISVAPGITELSGKANFPDHARPIAPFAMKECVFYQTSLYKWVTRQAGKSTERHREHITTLKSGDLISIEDDTGSVLARLNIDDPGYTSKSMVENLSGARPERYYLKVDRAKRDRPQNALLKIFGKFRADSRFDAFLQRNVPDYANYAGELEIEEILILKGDPIYIIGKASAIDEGGIIPAMIIEKDREKSLFCISDGNEKDALYQLGFSTYLMVFLGPIVFCAGLALAAAGFLAAGQLSSYLLPAIAIAAAGFLLYAYLFATLLIEMFNGTIVLRNGILRAKANVDVLLKRRADLIPNLAKAVSAYAKHEKKLQTSLARLRSTPMQNREGALLALAEGYPKLAADASFIALQSELARTENWIAASRAYTAESINLYNARIQSFPYFLFAPAMGLSPIPQSDSLS